MESRKSRVIGYQKLPKTRAKLREMGFHTTNKKSLDPTYPGTGPYEPEGTRHRDHESTEWARFSQEAEECRRNGAFSFRQD